ncbi:MAG: SURF1 family protein [Betaproteobacteria bacterium]|nr:SURF1 family protein [Betaproteobacteria bacterium]
MRLHFRLRWIPLIATLVVAGIGIALGNWQTRRAEEKIAMAEAINARSQLDPLPVAALPEDTVPDEFRLVTVNGSFVTDWPVYLDNRPLNGRAGFYLLMPLRVTGSDQAVLVLRGWFARDPQDRQRLPSIPVPRDEVKVIGRVRTSVGKLMQLGEAPALMPGAIVQNLGIEALATASRLPLQNFIIEQTNDLGDGLVRDWPLPAAGVDKHRAYAFQWYALSAAAFLFFIVTGFRRASKPNA